MLRSIQLLVESVNMSVIIHREGSKQMAVVQIVPTPMLGMVLAPSISIFSITRLVQLWQLRK